MDTTTPSVLLMVITVGVALSVLLGLILAFALQGMRRRLDQAMAKAEEAASQAQALRMELHPAKKSTTPPPRSRPASADETLVIKRR
jgi:Na+-transporting methylmalonyl-CoA/oxaloacetate decarboxylase gamma subunit